jgi:hypothetical protein
MKWNERNDWSGMNAMKLTEGWMAPGAALRQTRVIFATCVTFHSIVHWYIQDGSTEISEAWSHDVFTIMRLTVCYRESWKENRLNLGEVMLYQWREAQSSLGKTAARVFWSHGITPHHFRCLNFSSPTSQLQPRADTIHDNNDTILLPECTPWDNCLATLPPPVRHIFNQPA